MTTTLPLLRPIILAVALPLCALACLGALGAGHRAPAPDPPAHAAPAGAAPVVLEAAPGAGESTTPPRR